MPPVPLTAPDHLIPNATLRVEVAARVIGPVHNSPKLLDPAKVPPFRVRLLARVVRLRVRVPPVLTVTGPVPSAETVGVSRTSIPALTLPKLIVVPPM